MDLAVWNIVDQLTGGGKGFLFVGFVVHSSERASEREFCPFRGEYAGSYQDRRGTALLFACLGLAGLP